MLSRWVLLQLAVVLCYGIKIIIFSYNWIIHRLHAGNCHVKCWLFAWFGWGEAPSDLRRLCISTTEYLPGVWVGSMSCGIWKKRAKCLTWICIFEFLNNFLLSLLLFSTQLSSYARKATLRSTSSSSSSPAPRQCEKFIITNAKRV